MTSDEPVLLPDRLLAAVEARAAACGQPVAVTVAELVERALAAERAERRA